MVGSIVGDGDGADGSTDGNGEGFAVGTGVGFGVGFTVGIRVGTMVGVDVGSSLKQYSNVLGLLRQVGACSEFPRVSVEYVSSFALPHPVPAVSAIVTLTQEVFDATEMAGFMVGC